MVLILLNCSFSFFPLLFIGEFVIVISPAYTLCGSSGLQT